MGLEAASLATQSTLQCGMRQTRPTLPSSFGGVASSSSTSSSRKSKSKRGRYPRRLSIKQPWTTEQDEQLRVLVTTHGLGRWTVLAAELEGRSPKQCRERWLNHVDPSIIRRVWTPQEDRLLIELHEQLGNAWVRIAEQLPGRSANCVKNHWHGSSIRELLRSQMSGDDSELASDSDGHSVTRSPVAQSNADDEMWLPLATNSPRSAGCEFCSTQFGAKYYLELSDSELKAFLDEIDLDALVDDDAGDLIALSS